MPLGALQMLTSANYNWLDIASYYLLIRLPLTLVTQIQVVFVLYLAMTLVAKSRLVYRRQNVCSLILTQ